MNKAESKIQESYFDIISRYPKPSLEATKWFIERFTTDGSWYKHFPKNRCEEVIFFLDPNAGKSPIKVEILGDRKRFFFNKTSAMGWNYLVLKYLKNNNNELEIDYPYIGLNIVNEEGFLCPIPEEIQQLGSIKLSSSIHKIFENNKTLFEDDNPEITYAQKHLEEKQDLERTLEGILNKIYH